MRTNEKSYIKTTKSGLTVKRFFQARAAWHWELAEAVLNYNRCGLIIWGRNELDVVGGRRNVERAVKQFRELLKVLRQLSSHLKNDKYARKSLCEGMTDVLVNEFISASKPLPKSVRIYLHARKDFSTRSRQSDSRKFKQGQKQALDLIG